jgi:hypothetical protein
MNKNYWYCKNIIKKKDLIKINSELSYITNLTLKNFKGYRKILKENITKKLKIINKKNKNYIRNIYHYMQVYLASENFIDANKLSRKIKYLDGSKFFKFIPALRIDFPYDNRVNLPWHQEVYKMKDSEFFNIWFSIYGDVGPNNGSLIIKKFNKKKLFKHKLVNHGKIKKLTLIEDKEFKSLKEEKIILKEGDALVFTKYLPHKSGLNSSGEVRLTITQSFHAMKKDTKYPKPTYKDVL